MLRNFKKKGSNLKGHSQDVVGGIISSEEKEENGGANKKNNNGGSIKKRDSRGSFSSDSESDSHSEFTEVTELYT